MLTKIGSRLWPAIVVFAFLLVPACSPPPPPSAGTTAKAAQSAPESPPEPDYILDTSNTHNRFSSTIPPTLTVAPGAVVEVHTKEATDGQIGPDSSLEDLLDLEFDLIHPLTGPIYVEGAEPGDVLTVTFHEIEVKNWGWTAISPGFGFLADEFAEPWLRTFELQPGQEWVRFAEGVSIPLRPFPGVIGVAPATEELLSTIPPRANGGNMDNRYLTVGTTVHLPVFVEGALLSLGDTHAAQGDGEVCGTGLEAPMRIVLEIGLRKGGREIEEPQYETAEYYAVTAFAESIDEAAKKATRYMLDYLVAEHNLSRPDAYALASLAADLKISEVVDMPHVLVSMHIPKDLFEAH
ncbi:MAG: acetamidase/formamidase family protein [Acidobacteria bacterium]|nr:acetamidase/formamidase family protein [Acidobacteriota bacterium]